VSLSGTASGYAEFETLFDRLFGDLYHYLHLQGVRSMGQSLAIYNDLQGIAENISVEVCVTLPYPIPSRDQFNCSNCLAWTPWPVWCTRVALLRLDVHTQRSYPGSNPTSPVSAAQRVSFICAMDARRSKPVNNRNPNSS